MSAGSVAVPHLLLSLISFLIWNGPEKRDQERRDNEPGNGKEVQLSRRRFTKEFKLAAVRRLEAGESGSALARELEVKREKLYD